MTMGACSKLDHSGVDARTELAVALEAAPWRIGKRAEIRNRKLAAAPDIASPPGFEKEQTKGCSGVVFELPPGLECVGNSIATSPVPVPPGLQSSRSSETTVPPQQAMSAKHNKMQPHVKVSVCGIPQRLLSEASVEVMLEQVGLLESLLSFTINRSGLVCLNVFYENDQGAQRCVDHFHGRLWGKLSITAYIERPLATFVGLSKPTATALSASAPIFVPKFGLSAISPAFIRVRESMPIGKPLSTRSDASTDLGESETEEESPVSDGAVAYINYETTMLSRGLYLCSDVGI